MTKRPPKLAKRPYRSQTVVNLADLIETCAHLKPTEEQAGAIAGSMGFEWRYVESSGDQRRSDQEKPKRDARKGPQHPTTHGSSRPIPASQIEVPLMRSVDVQDPQAEQLFAAPSLEAVTPLPSTDPDLHLKIPPYEPLFEDHWFRAIATALLGMPVASREIDSRKLQRRIVKGRLLETLPWKMRRSLRSGVQLLFDRSDSMQPFLRDQDELLRRLVRILGKRAVEARYFATDAMAGVGTDPVWDWRPLDRFTSDRPLLIVSDFTLGTGFSRVRFDRWIPVLYLARKHRCPVLALIPLPASNWPPQLIQLFPKALAWDRDTSPQTVRRLRSQRPDS